MSHKNGKTKWIRLPPNLWYVNHYSVPYCKKHCQWVKNTDNHLAIRNVSAWSAWWNIVIKPGLLKYTLHTIHRSHQTDHLQFDQLLNETVAVACAVAKGTANDGRIPCHVDSVLISLSDGKRSHGYDGGLEHLHGWISCLELNILNSNQMLPLNHVMVKHYGVKPETGCGLTWDELEKARVPFRTARRSPCDNDIVTEGLFDPKKSASVNVRDLYPDVLNGNTWVYVIFKDNKPSNIKVARPGLD
jgi:hypothetical protein